VPIITRLATRVSLFTENISHVVISKATARANHWYFLMVSPANIVNAKQ
jgi:hypothetical protein